MAFKAKVTCGCYTQYTTLNYICITKFDSIINYFEKNGPTFSQHSISLSLVHHVVGSLYNIRERLSEIEWGNSTVRYFILYDRPKGSFTTQEQDGERESRECKRKSLSGLSRV